MPTHQSRETSSVRAWISSLMIALPVSWHFKSLSIFGRPFPCPRQWPCLLQLVLKNWTVIRATFHSSASPDTTQHGLLDETATPWMRSSVYQSCIICFYSRTWPICSSPMAVLGLWEVVEMVQYDCHKHWKPTVSFSFGVVRIPFSHYWPSGVIRIGFPVWRWRRWEIFRIKWA